MNRELDAEIAEKVMGLAVEYTNKAWDMDDWLGSDTPTERNTYAIVNTDWKPGASYPHHSVIPHYSTDIAAAWTIVERMRELNDDAYGVWAEALSDSEHCTLLLELPAAEAALAICLAARRATGGQTNA